MQTNRFRARSIYPFLLFSTFLLFSIFLPPIFAPAAAAADYLEVDCTACHTEDLDTIHHQAATSQGLECSLCHLFQWNPATNSYVVLTDRNCTNCHGGAAHEAAHDQAFFSPDPQASQLCLTCHQEMVAEHLARDLDCAACHSSSDPLVTAAIASGSGPDGEPVYCLNCHGKDLEPYGLHTAAHDAACIGCHPVTPDAYGKLLGVHTGAASISGSICVDCHRLGTDDLARNSIFTVPVNKDAGEPPDTDYQPAGYFLGPCAKCHGKTGHMTGKISSGCLGCHYPAAEDSFPNPANGYFGSQVWGHRFQMKNR